MLSFSLIIFRGGWPSEFKLRVLSNERGRLLFCFGGDGLVVGLGGCFGGPIDDGVLAIDGLPVAEYLPSKAVGVGRETASFFEMIFVRTLSVCLNFRDA